MPASCQPTVLVCGLGQPLRGDDGVGLAAVRRWEAVYFPTERPRWLQVCLLETPELGLLNALEGATAALLVDGVRSGAPPGTLHHLTLAEVARFAPGWGSAHGWGVAESLALAETLGMSLPPRLALLGIAIGGLHWGEALSTAVAAALPQAVAAIQAWVLAAHRALPPCPSALQADGSPSSSPQPAPR